MQTTTILGSALRMERGFLGLPSPRGGGRGLVGHVSPCCCHPIKVAQVFPPPGEKGLRVTDTSPERHPGQEEDSKDPKFHPRVGSHQQAAHLLHRRLWLCPAATGRLFEPIYRSGLRDILKLRVSVSPSPAGRSLAFGLPQTCVVAMALDSPSSQEPKNNE